MRWKPKERPKQGDRRIIETFLWLPKKLGGEWVWLEKVRLEQEARWWCDPTCGASGIEWVTIKEKPKIEHIR